jgi:hypothetical protein
MIGLSQKFNVFHKLFDIFGKPMLFFTKYLICLTKLMVYLTQKFNVFVRKIDKIFYRHSFYIITVQSQKNKLIEQIMSSFNDYLNYFSNLINIITYIYNNCLYLSLIKKN